MNENLSKHIHKERITGTLSNTVINGLIAWALLKDAGEQVLYGEKSYAIDLAATGFILPLVIGLIMIAIHRNKVNKGSLQTISNDELGMASYFPYSNFKSSLLFALIGLLVITPITVGLLALIGVETLSAMQYIIFKGIWCGLLVAMLLGTMIKVSLQEAPAKMAAAA